MRGILLCLIAVLFVIPLAAGNRADVNADQAVNAADTVLLANIVAGNLDVANYDLETVVVVAAQGGDFTNPVDAAEWVVAQAPDSTHRFVILITPGVYQVGEDIVLPDYTTVQGYGHLASKIVRGPGGSGTTLAYCPLRSGVSLRDLTLRNEANGAAGNYVLRIDHSSDVDLSGLALELSGTSGTNVLLNLGDSVVSGRNLLFRHDSGSKLNTAVHVDNANLTLAHATIAMINPSFENNVTGIAMIGSSTVMIRDTVIGVVNQMANRSASCILINGTTVFQGFNSSLQAVSASAGYNAYYSSDATDHTVKFFCCLLDGSASIFGTLIRFGCYNSNGVAVP